MKDVNAGFEVKSLKAGSGKFKLDPQSSLFNPFALSFVLLGLVLRLIGLGDRAFWFDEAISAVYARNDINTLFALNQGDNHPFGYYLTLKFWIDLFGSTDATIRLLSVLPGVAAIWLVWLIGQRLFPERPQISLLAVFLMAVSPFQVYFSQEARNYSFMEFWVLLAVWFWLRGLENNRWADWLGLGLAGAFGIVYNFTTAFYLAALFIWPLFAVRQNWANRVIWRMWLAGAGGGLLAGLALLPKLTSRLTTIKGNFWIPVPDPLVVLRTFFTFIFGAIQPDRLLIAFALAFVIFIVVVGQAVPVWWKKRLDDGLSRSLWLLFGPITLVIILSLLFQPLYLDKALIACSPFYFLLIGWAIFRADIGRQGKAILTAGPLLVAIILAALALPDLYSGQIQPLFIARYDAPKINSYLAAHPAEAVISVTDISWLPLVYYGPKSPPAKYPLAEYPYPNIFPLLVEKLNSEYMPKAEIGKRFKKFWLVFELNPPDGPYSTPQKADLSHEPTWIHSSDWQRDTFNYFNSTYNVADAVELDRVLLVLYEQK